MPDDLDRDRFYASSEDDLDDDGEYEVEPPDAEVLAAEERRVQAAVAAAEDEVDIDAIYRDMAGSSVSLDRWAENFRFRFRVKHMLIATAVVAILLAIGTHRGFGTVFVLTMLVTVGGVMAYLQWQELQHEREANRRRQAMYARRRKATRAKLGPADDQADQEATDRVVDEPLPSEVDALWQQAMADQKSRLKFTLRELMIAVTCAALLLGSVQLLGGTHNAATLLGFIALGGLIAHAMGFDPPHVVVLGWWMLLVLYVLLSIFAAIVGTA